MIEYNKGTGKSKNWIVSESNFSIETQGKCEAIMALGNGYLGIRSATEEAYIGQVKNTFIAGTFNKSNTTEVTELPNCADVTQVEVFIDGVRVNLESGKISAYERFLNIRTGELVRKFIWESEDGKKLQLTFCRFVSQVNLHLIGQKIEISPLNFDGLLEIKSGINGQLTNSGSQHFIEGEKRIYDAVHLECIQTTSESAIDFILQSKHHYFCNGIREIPKVEMNIDRRYVSILSKQEISQGNTYKLEKMSVITTSRDLEFVGKSLEDIRKETHVMTKQMSENGYDGELAKSSACWKSFWETQDVIISGKDYDQLAIRFALYHLQVMTPKHDNRMGVAAKGLSGEGYKGHSFWDTEIFVLPHFAYTNPKIARSLLEYRVNTLPGAHQKAKDNGYEGAMFPWESAWYKDGEVTPIWGGIDIVTGKATKILSGFIEQHITADIAYAVWQYYMITGDQEFMDQSGYELLFDTAKFWVSRLEKDEKTGQYGINNVIGPDEYKEHINNNAFTNYLVDFNFELALIYAKTLKETNNDLYTQLDAKLNLQKIVENIEQKRPLLILPQPNESGIIPQDDTYLTKQDIDLSVYKNQAHVGRMFKDYNLTQVNEIQVSKQADVVLLCYLLENKFGLETKKINFDYYEARTLHDSSLSLSTHAIIGSDLGDVELAYGLFKKAMDIDLGPNMKTSDHGIHAASLAGIWQYTINGAGGVRMLDGNLRISPHLPKEWTTLTYPIMWRGVRLEIEATHTDVKVWNRGEKTILFETYGKQYELGAQTSISIKKV